MVSDLKQTTMKMTAEFFDGDESDTNSVTLEEIEELFPDHWDDELDKMEEELVLK